MGKLIKKKEKKSVRAINQACSSFAADPKRRRRRRAKYDSVCLSEAKQKLIQDLWFSRITHSLLTLHICFAFDEATHQGRTGAAAFFFFPVVSFPSALCFLSSHRDTSQHSTVCSSGGAALKKKKKKKKGIPRRPKSISSCR